MATAIPIRPIWKIELNHPATLVASTPEAKRVVIASDALLISVAELGQSSKQTISRTEPARHIATNPDGNSLAVVNASRTLQVLGLESGTFGRELARWDALAYEACAFSRDGKSLWTVSLQSDEIAEIHCYDARTGKTIGRQQLKLFIGGCGFVLTLHPQDDLFGLWACGGPDELWNYWIRRTETALELRHQPELDGCTPPSFNTRGDRFVTLNGYDLAAFSFPNCGSLYPPITGDEDDPWVESMCYLDLADDRVLASTNEGRIFVVALEQGEVIAEVQLEGHEPKPCYQVYSSLSKTDNRLCTDLHTFTSLARDLILSVHTNGKVSDRKDTILFWHAPSGE